jgi:hypothetical protein
MMDNYLFLVGPCERFFSARTCGGIAAKTSDGPLPFYRGAVVWLRDIFFSRHDATPQKQVTDHCPFIVAPLRRCEIFFYHQNAHAF